MIVVVLAHPVSPSDYINQQHHARSDSTMDGELFLFQLMPLANVIRSEDQE